MRYRKFGNTGLEISALSFGTMRLPTYDNQPFSPNIIEDEAIKMLRYAIDQGVNYIDTAYPYHGEQSEVLVGKALKDGYRDKVYLATKCPLYKIKREEEFEEILEEQLKKLQVDCIDFYLLHAVNKNKWKDIVLKFDFISKLEKAKEQGKIKYIGFSFHDDYETFREIIDYYDKWDFCQIQLNYIDVDNQAGIKGLKYAAEKGLGVIIMEPLLGGKLADPPVEVSKVLSPKKTPVEWALDFLWDLNGVSFLLSGMGTMDQIKDNINYADRSDKGMLLDEEKLMFEKAKFVYDNMALVPCTKCSYCMPCSFGLDIPKIYEAYNKTATSKFEAAKAMYEEIEIKADSCRKCKKCEKVCPQDIKTSEIMPKIHEAFQKA